MVFKRLIDGVSAIYLGPASLQASNDPPPGKERATLNAGIHGLSTHETYGL